MKLLRKPRTYMAEFNRCVGDSVSVVIRRFQRLGYDVERIPHLTALKIQRPAGRSFQDFKSDLRNTLQRRRGSLILSSSSGRAWSCSMRGNRPGDFVRQY